MNSPAQVPNPLDRAITKGELADLLGVGRSTVSNWIAAGLPTLGPGVRAKVNLRVAVYWLYYYVNPCNQDFLRMDGWCRAEELVLEDQRRLRRAQAG
jgi:phage terminase Nu1 subunit (DNA packaging protein)